MAYCEHARRLSGFDDAGPVTVEMARAIVHPEDRARIRAITDRTTDPAIREAETYVFRILRANDGALRWLRAHGIAEFDRPGPDATALRYTGSLEDVTEAEENRLALIESEAHLRVALDAADMAVWEYDIEANRITPNPALNRLYGFPEDATPTLDEFRSRYAPGEVERLDALGAELAATGQTMLQTRVRHVLPDGQERTFVVRAALAPVTAGGRTRNIGVVFDVTEAARQEDRIATAAQELKHRLKNMASITSILAGRTWPKDERYETFTGRVRAMMTAADLMFGETVARIALRDLIDRVLEPFRGRHEGSIELIDLPDAALDEQRASGLAMVLYELGTNATKYGALSVPGGRVRIDVGSAPDGVELHWTEIGGPPVVPPERMGFGTLLIRQGALKPPDRVEMTYDPAGLRVAIRLVGVGAEPS